MTRARLPNRRHNVNQTVVFSGTAIDLSFGHDDDGKIKEVFVSTRKLGTALDIMARDATVMLSFLLQYGIDLNELLDVFAADEHGSVEGFAGIVAKMILKENENGLHKNA